DMYVNAHVEAALSVSARAINALAILSGAAACMMTIAYGIYIAWCWRQGYFVSIAKLTLLVVTFGVMYLTYTPNAWIQALAPGWSFKVGFAAVGIVHMTQYLAIVWRYNRSLAANPERTRSGLFRFWHGAKPKTRAGHAIAWLFAGLYVAVCLAYGDIVTTQHEGRWVMSVLLAVGFTSTLMHYYFDGFIWKVRHRQNSEALIMAPTGQASNQISGQVKESTSWWNTAVRMTAARMFVRQLVYFGVPMTLLTVGAMAAWRVQDGGYVEHMYRAQALAQQGEQSAAEDEARTAYAAMNKQLPFSAKMAELEPTAAREAELAFLIYNQSLYQHIVMPQLAGQSANVRTIAAHRDRIRQAIEVLSSAMARGTSLAHAGRERMTEEDAQRVIESWERSVR
ncbi:MAG TPA: hypothetical protein VK629_11035, partial [Steroidobacteraceae bacterium]|nr:hypothetical protein [Steroidobacteraceae bacterium]